jgi:hypothetical protein
VVQVTEVIDIAPVLERKLEASLCHQTMLRNYVNQVRMQAKTGGWTLPVLDAVAGGRDLGPFVEMLIRGGAREVGQRHDLEAAEEFRVVRFGGLEGFLGRYGRRL